jgi:RND family efflux transporter MFP subunit
MKLLNFFITTAAIAAFAGCSRHETAAGGGAALPSVRVRTATVRFESVPTMIEITGTVRPLRRATLAAKLMGSIEELPVALGQSVRAGDLLVKLSAGEISARLAQAQAQLGQAKRDLTRERDLLLKSASTADTVGNLETRVTLYEATVREAETMLGYAFIRAPFDGVVARKFAEVGDLASPGVPLLEVEGTGAFQVEAGIPDSLASALQIGAPTDITIVSANAVFAAPLAELSSAADSNAHTVSAKFTVPTGVMVRSGQFARVQVQGATIRILLAPGAAVSQSGQMERGFVMRRGANPPLRTPSTGQSCGVVEDKKGQVLMFNVYGVRRRHCGPETANGGGRY